MKESRTIVLDEKDLKEIVAEKYECDKSDVQIKIENDGYGDEVIVMVRH